MIFLTKRSSFLNKFDRLCKKVVWHKIVNGISILAFVLRFLGEVTLL